MGTDESVTFCGTLCDYRPYGAIVAAASVDREELIQAEISENVIESVRSRMAVIDHRRQTCINRSRLTCRQKTRWWICTTNNRRRSWRVMGRLVGLGWKNSQRFLGFARNDKGTQAAGPCAAQVSKPVLPKHAANQAVARASVFATARFLSE
jgi:hypothetical protein